MRRLRGASFAAGLCLLLAAGAAQAQVQEMSISASVDREEVEVGGELVLSITTSSPSQETGDVQIPPLGDFDVLHRSQSSQMSFSFGTGGSTSLKQITWTLILAPKKQGTLVIPPATLAFKGRTWRTQPITVRVVPAGQATRAPPPRRGQPGFALAEPTADARSIFVRVTLDKPRAYLGEQVTMTVTLYSRVDISRIEGMTMPRLDGFWAEDIESPTQITGELRQIEGVPYRAYVLKRRALFPMRAGKLVIDPVEVEVATGFGLFFSGRTARRASPKVELEVQPLPGAGRPEGFDSVNVGEWTLTREIDPVLVSPAQPITYRLVLEGRGNLRSLDVPRLPPIPGIKIYEPTQEDKVKIERGRYGGRRTLDYLLIPEQTGTLAVPPLEMWFFDPTTGQYRVARVEGAALEVKAGAAGSALGGAPASQSGANLLASGLKPIRHRSALRGAGLPLYRRPWFAPLVALPFVLLGALAIADRVRGAIVRAAPEKRMRRARARAQRRLRGAQNLLKEGRTDAFCAEVDRALVDYIADRAGVPARGLTHEEVRRRLEAAGHKPDAVALLYEAMESCDALRFSPAGAEEEARRQVWIKAGEALAQMEAR